MQILLILVKTVRFLKYEGFYSTTIFPCDPEILIDCAEPPPSGKDHDREMSV